MIKINSNDLFNLVRSSEWLYDEDNNDTKEGRKENKNYIKLTKKLKELYESSKITDKFTIKIS